MRYIRIIDNLDNEYLTTYKEHCEMVAKEEFDILKEVLL